MARRQRQVGYVVPTGVPTRDHWLCQTRRVGIGGTRTERCVFQRVYHLWVHIGSNRVGCPTQGTSGGTKEGTRGSS